MKNYTFNYHGCAEYIADSEEEAKIMFENDYFDSREMDIDEIIEEEIEEDD